MSCYFAQAMSVSFRFKQVLIVRSDLDIGRGKAAVQCAHAAVSAAEEARNHLHSWWKSWMEEGQLKVALKVPDLESVLELEQKGRSKGIPVHLVRDRGLTQVPPGTITCLGLGPAPADVVDSLTGNLALL
jgi:peptidyl-tRNA hydrolase, PTH2 family